MGQNVLVENLSQVNLETLSWSEKKKKSFLGLSKGLTHFLFFSEKTDSLDRLSRVFVQRKLNRKVCKTKADFFSRFNKFGSSFCGNVIEHVGNFCQRVFRDFPALGFFLRALKAIYIYITREEKRKIYMYHGDHDNNHEILSSAQPGLKITELRNRLISFWFPVHGSAIHGTTKK